MATVFELHHEHEPIHVTAPSFSLVSSSTPVKSTSHNAPSEKKEDVAELLWSEMKNGGWVQDNRVLDRFKHMPPADATNRRVGIPQTVTKEEELYQPLVDYVNALTARSTLRFINSSTYYPKQSPQHSASTSNDLASENEQTKESRLRPDLLGLSSDDAESFETSVKNPDSDTRLYWMLVELFWEVKKTSTASDWLVAREQSATYARQVRSRFICYTVG